MLGQVCEGGTSHLVIEAVMEAGKRAGAAELFQKYDADSSGTIDMDELTLMMAECGYGHPPKELMSEFATGMDEDLDYEAFAAMLRSLDARTQFEKFDVDRSGGIDIDELLAAMHACGHTNAERSDAGRLLLQFSEGETTLNVDQFQSVLEQMDTLNAEQFQREKTDALEPAQLDAPRPEPRLVCVGTMSDQDNQIAFVCCTDEREGDDDARGVVLPYSWLLCGTQCCSETAFGERESKPDSECADFPRGGQTDAGVDIVG